MVSHQGDRGDYVLTVTATDDGNAGASLPQTGQASFVLSVTSTNEPPIMGVVGNRIALIGQELTFNVNVSDADQDPLTFSATGLPAGATFVSASIYGVATFRWTPTAADAGIHSITLRVTDSGNNGAGLPLSDSRTVLVTVRASNSEPVLGALGDGTVASGSPLAIQVLATDVDNDTLNYNLANVPLGATFDRATGLFQWTPRLVDAGTYFLNFSVTDGAATVARTVTLTVTATNLPPVFAPVLPQTGQEGVTLAFTVVAGDPNGDLPNLFVANGLPAGAVFGASTGFFLWTPSFSQSGTQTVRFGAIDSQGLQAFLDVSITVQNVNRPPAIPGLSAHQLLVGQSFSFAVPGSDADAQDTGLLTYTAQNLPAGAAFNASGLFSWTPLASQLGSHFIAFTVTDVTGATANATLNLEVVAQRQAPDVQISLTPGFPITAGHAVTIAVLADGVADIASVQLRVAGVLQTLDAQRRVIFTPAAPGHYDVEAIVTDLDGLVTTVHADLRVRDLSDVAAPVVAIALPPAGAILTASAPVVATVEDMNLDHWKLTLSSLDGRFSRTLASGLNGFSSSAVATLNPGDLVNGAYLLNLTAQDMAGRQTVVNRLVEIATATKSAAYTRAETDATVTLDGVSLAIARVYDSLRADTAGLAGYGWRFPLLEPNLSTNLLPTGTESYGLFAPYQDGTRVYLDAPDGQRLAFTFAPQSMTVGALTVYKAAWTGPAGFILTSDPEVLQKSGTQYYDLVTGLAYNSSTFTLSGAVTGASLVYRRTTSGFALGEIVATSGNRLLVSDSGIVSATTGARVNLVKDALGRIISLQLPTAAETRYSYSAKGDLLTVISSAASARTWYGYHDPHPHLLTAVAPAAGAGALIKYDSGGLFASSNAVPVLLGGVANFLGVTQSSATAAGGTDRYLLILGGREVASAASGSLTLGFDFNGNTATPEIDGALASGSALIGGHRISLFTFNEAGPFVMSVSSGSYQFEIFVPGDLNGDHRVDGTDAAVASADVNRDGAIDSTDAAVRDGNYGFTANHAPVMGTTTLNTIKGFSVTYDLTSLASDSDGNALTFFVGGAVNGMVTLANDGRTVTFTPNAGYFGTASFTVFADDGLAMSPVTGISVSVADAIATRLDVTPADPVIAVGGSTTLQVTATFTGGLTRVLPSAMVTFTSVSSGIAAVTSAGTLLGVSAGTSAIRIDALGLTIATGVTVGLQAAREFDFFPHTYTVVVNDRRQFMVRERVDNSILDRSAAGAGAFYFVGNAALGSITADGLFTATATGTLQVTTVFAGRSFIAELLITTASNTTATVGADGGYIRNNDGVAIGIPQGALSQKHDYHGQHLPSGGCSLQPAGGMELRGRRETLRNQRVRRPAVQRGSPGSGGNGRRPDRPAAATGVRHHGGWNHPAGVVPGRHHGGGLRWIHAHDLAAELWPVRARRHRLGQSQSRSKCLRRGGRDGSLRIAGGLACHRGQGCPPADDRWRRQPGGSGCCSVVGFRGRRRRSPGARGCGAFR